MTEQVTAAAIEAIKAAQLQLSRLIAAEIKPGERYGGPVLDKEGEVSHFLIKTAHKSRNLTYRGALAWAEEEGAFVLTPQEGSILYANLPDEFKKQWHWLDKQSGADSAFAQGFSGGHQGSISKSHELAVVLVRRLVL